jgi:hypothetical protein
LRLPPVGCAVRLRAAYGLQLSFFSAVLVHVGSVPEKHKFAGVISIVTAMSSVAGAICGPGKLMLLIPIFHL